MCLASHADEIIETLRALKEAEAELVQWRGTGFGGGDGKGSIRVTHDEGTGVLERRMEALKARCRELGVHGPAPKANSADQVRIASQK